jgi:hypothetical protein
MRTNDIFEKLLHGRLPNTLLQPWERDSRSSIFAFSEAFGPLL